MILKVILPSTNLVRGRMIFESIHILKLNHLKYRLENSFKRIDSQTIKVYQKSLS